MSRNPVCTYYIIQSKFLEYRMLLSSPCHWLFSTLVNPFVCKIWELVSRPQIKYDYARWNMMFFLCNSVPKVLGHLMFISKGTPNCAEECCFTTCLILPCWSPVDVAQFPLLAVADSQHTPPNLSLQSPCSAPTLSLSQNLLSHWTPLSPPLSSNRTPPAPLLSASSFWKTTGAAGSTEGGLSGGNSVQAGFWLSLDPLCLQMSSWSPRPILHLISGHPLTSVCCPFHSILAQRLSQLGFSNPNLLEFSSIHSNHTKHH